MKKLFLANLAVLFILSCVSKYSGEDLSIEYFNIGNAYSDLEDLDNAIKYYKKSLVYNSEFNKSRFNLIDIYMYKEDLNSAKEQLEILLAYDKENLKLKKLSAYLSYREGDLGLALNKYLDLFDSGDQSYDVLISIIKLYYQEDDLVQALAFSDKLHKDSVVFKGMSVEDKVEFYYLTGLIYKETENDDKALSYWEECYSLDGKDLFILKLLLEEYTELEDHGKVQEILTVLIGVDSDNKGFYLFRLAEVSFLGLNNFSEGYIRLEEAIEAGYKDKDKFNELLEKPNLIGVDKIRQLLIDNEILEE